MNIFLNPIIQFTHAAIPQNESQQAVHSNGKWPTPF